MKALVMSWILAFSALLPVPAQEVWALRVARAHLGDGQVMAPATLVMKGERILTIGATIEVPKGARLVDLGTAELTPGFIDGASQFGLLRGESDNEERSEITPGVRAAGFVDENSPQLRQAFRSGTTTVVIHPGSRNVVGGQVTLVRTGASVAATEQETFGLRVSLGLDPTVGNGGRGVGALPPRRPNSRMGVVYEARRAFSRARDYVAAKSNREAAVDPELELLAQALDGRTVVFWQAESAKDIYTALRIAEEFGVQKSVIVGAQEAGLTAAALERTKVPAFVGPLYHLQRRGGRGPNGVDTVTSPDAHEIEGSPTDDHEGHAHAAVPAQNWPLWVDEEEHLLKGCNCCAAGFPNYEALEPLPPVVTPELLFRAKAPFCLAGGELEPGQTLLDFARFAVRLGLPRERAIAVITSEPARFLGLQDRVGMIRAGLVADLVVFSGDPLCPTSSVRAVVSGGRMFQLSAETKP